MNTRERERERETSKLGDSDKEIMLLHLLFDLHWIDVGIFKLNPWLLSNNYYDQRQVVAWRKMVKLEDLKVKKHGKNKIDKEKERERKK